MCVSQCINWTKTNCSLIDAHIAAVHQLVDEQLQGLQEMRWIAVKVTTIQMDILYVKYHRYHQHRLELTR